MDEEAEREREWEVERQSEGSLSSPLQRPAKTWVGAAYPWLVFARDGDDDAGYGLGLGRGFGDDECEGVVSEGARDAELRWRVLALAAISIAVLQAAVQGWYGLGGRGWLANDRKVVRWLEKGRLAEIRDAGW